MKPKYRLIDAPTRTTSTKLQTPDLVKVIIETPDGNTREFVWVRVAGPLRGPDADPQLYAGTIHSEPGDRDLPRLGTVIEFGLEHVVDLAVVLKVRGCLELLQRPIDDTHTT